MAGARRGQLPDPLHHFGFPLIQIFKKIFAKKTSRARSLHSGTTKKALCDVHTVDSIIHYHSRKYS
jgi:hypothetical protein